MSEMKDVIKLLDRVISMEDTEPLTMLGSYILGPITTDFQDLEESNFLVGLISEHANRLEVLGWYRGAAQARLVRNQKANRKTQTATKLICN